MDGVLTLVVSVAGDGDKDLARHGTTSCEGPGHSKASAIVTKGWEDQTWTSERVVCVVFDCGRSRAILTSFYILHHSIRFDKASTYNLFCDPINAKPHSKTLRIKATLLSVLSAQEGLVCTAYQGVC